MPRLIDLTGRTFGRLTVIERAGSDKQGFASWECGCQCGAITVVRGKSLTRGHTTSCGCKVGRGQLPDKRFYWIPGETPRRKPKKSIIGRIVHSIRDIFRRLFKQQHTVKSKPKDESAIVNNDNEVINSNDRVKPDDKVDLVDDINEAKTAKEPIRIDLTFLDPLMSTVSPKTPKKRGRKPQIEGAQFGKLHIGDFMGVNQDNQKLYSASCSCGNDLVVTLDDLQSGAVTDCGKCGKDTNANRNS